MLSCELGESWPLCATIRKCPFWLLTLISVSFWSRSISGDEQIIYESLILDKFSLAEIHFRYYVKRAIVNVLFY